VFRGSGECIDHVVVSPSLAPGSEIDVVHVDAEFPVAERASDHDPVVVRLALGPSPR
jgi:predicted extracellular nuclease